MADLQSKVRDRSDNVSISVILGEHKVTAMVALTRNDGPVAAISPVWQGEMARDGMVAEPTVQDVLHEVLHLLQEMGMCPSNPAL